LDAYEKRQTGRVHELDGAEVDEHRAGGVGNDVVQRRDQPRRGRDVDLPPYGQQLVAVGLDPLHGKRFHGGSQPNRSG
jgi:hypothetical protein